MSNLTTAARRFLPGLALCVAIVIASAIAAQIEAHLFGQAWIEALVIAILIGVAVRSAWTPGPAYKPGIDLSAKFLLEVAVVLLGASISAATVLAAGPYLIAGIVAVVVIALFGSYWLGRMIGLPPRLAMLVACGNSICGNSAIAAAAPIIGATGDEVASSIAFTAVLGVIIVLFLPLAAPLLHYSALQYGVLAGLTVYAVPQVLAAAAPLGLLSVQMGTLVKLTRVLMLGPVLVVLGLRAHRDLSGRLSFRKLVPWFIIGFVALILLRSLGLIPAAVLPVTGWFATWLTVLAMAALGLGVDVRTVARAGGPVTLAVVLSLLLIGVISVAMIHLLRIG